MLNMRLLAYYIVRLWSLSNPIRGTFLSSILSSIKFFSYVHEADMLTFCVLMCVTVLIESSSLETCVTEPAGIILAAPRV